MPAPAAKRWRSFLHSHFVLQTKLPHGIIASHQERTLTPWSLGDVGRTTPGSSPPPHPLASADNSFSRVGIQQRYSRIQIHIRTCPSARIHHHCILQAADRHLSCSTFRFYPSLNAPYICYLSRTVFYHFFLYPVLILLYYLPPCRPFFVCFFTPPLSQYAISVCFGSSFVVYSSSLVTQSSGSCLLSSHRIFIAECD